MSSAIHIINSGITDDAWDNFARTEKLKPESPLLVSDPSGKLLHSGWVEIAREDDVVTFSTFHMGEALPQVALLARKFWLAFGGEVHAAPQLRELFLGSREYTGHDN
ncbi:MAG TPA: hypothetical protein VFQ44_01915 [Streptosporangiaceae bacterium]|nr:hypothetical protein [Streptosporangiaceae bacterium]